MLNVVAHSQLSTDGNFVPQMNMVTQSDKGRKIKNKVLFTMTRIKGERERAQFTYSRSQENQQATIINCYPGNS